MRGPAELVGKPNGFEPALSCTVSFVICSDAQSMRAGVEGPDAAEHEAILDVVVAGRVIAVEVERILRVFRIVCSWHDSRRIGAAVFDFRDGVRETRLPIVVEALLDIERDAVVLRARGRLKLNDAAEVRERTCAAVALESRVTDLRS